MSFPQREDRGYRAPSIAGLVREWNGTERNGSKEGCQLILCPRERAIPYSLHSISELGDDFVGRDHIYDIPP